MNDPTVLAQVAAKYLARGQPLPDKVPKGQPVEYLRGLRNSLKALLPGSAPDCGEKRPEFLRVLGEDMEEEDIVNWRSLGWPTSKETSANGSTQSGSLFKPCQSSRPQAAVQSALLVFAPPF